MSRSRSVSETSVGLFAFLDVLMSTMGSLILVLMVVTPKIRQEAVAKAAASAHRPSAIASPLKVQPAPEKKPTYAAPVELPREIVDLNAPLKAEIAELSQQAVEQQRLVDDKHQALGTAQASLIKSQSELDELEKRLAEILRAKRRMAASVAKVSSDGVAVESELTGAAARLRTIKGQIADASTVYTFVAYDGVSGTTRRPILVECTREHIKFVQENVSLSSTDVSGYAPSYNPVLAGAQALLDYWASHSAPGDPRPYVLLIVRPNGAVAYATARRLLERLKDSFGYELLPDDQQLAVPPPVPEAAEACRRAVDKAISERVDVFKQVFGAPSRGKRGNGLVAGGGGPGADPAGKSSGQGGQSASLFDDLDGNSPTGSQGTNGTGGTGQSVAQAEANGQPGQPGGASSQPGGPSSQPGGPSSQPGGPSSQPGGNGANSSSGSSTDGAGKTTTPGSATPGPAMPGSATPGSGTPGSGTSASGTPGTGTDRGAGVFLSDTGPLATGRTAGRSAGTSVLGVGTPASESTSPSGPVSIGSTTGQSAGGGLGLGSPGAGAQPPGSQAAGSQGAGSQGTGSPGTGSPVIGSAGTGLQGGQLQGGALPGTLSQGTGLQGTGTGDARGPNGQTGGLGPGGTGGLGSPGSGLTGGGLAAGGSLDGASPANGGTPGANANGTNSGSPATGKPVPGTPGSDPAGTGSGGAPSRSEFPPSIIPRSGSGESPGAGGGSEGVMVGHPTPGDGNQGSDEIPTGRAGQSGLGSGTGSFPSGLESSGSSGSSDGSVAGGSSRAGSSDGGSGQGDSSGAEAGENQSPSGGSPGGGSGGQPSAGQPGGGQAEGGQPDGGQAGGSPSMGSPAGPGGDAGETGAGNRASPGGKAMDGMPSFSSGGEDDGGPRRRNQGATQHWGMSDPRATIGYEHDVTVYVEAHRISVGSQPPLACGRRENSKQLAQSVLRALNREARTWGRPRDNFYWVPAPKIVICPGGLVQYQRIEPALLRYGLHATFDYRLELSRPAPLPSLVTE